MKLNPINICARRSKITLDSRIENLRQHIRETNLHYFGKEEEDKFSFII